LRIKEHNVHNLLKIILHQLTVSHVLDREYTGIVPNGGL